MGGGVRIEVCVWGGGKPTRSTLSREDAPFSLKSSLPSFPALSDIALRFLTHLVGDLHQPLHLTGLLRGGNGLPVRFQGRQLSLHALWDGVLVNRAIRELGGWTTPTADPRLEGALRGRIYDPLVRAIVIEGALILVDTAPPPPFAASRRKGKRPSLSES